MAPSEHNPASSRGERGGWAETANPNTIAGKAITTRVPGNDPTVRKMPDTLSPMAERARLQTRGRDARGRGAEPAGPRPYFLGRGAQGRSEPAHHAEPRRS